MLKRLKEDTKYCKKYNINIKRLERLDLPSEYT